MDNSTPMLTLNGRILNVYDQAQTTDKKTGEIRPATTRVQIQAENTLENGQKRIELVSLKVSHGDPFKKALNRSVRIPVGVFAAGGSLFYYALNGGMGAKFLEEKGAV